MIFSFDNHQPQLDESVFLTPSSDVIGDVMMGRDSSLWFHTVVRGDVNWIRIGERTNIQDGCILHVSYKTFPLKIGNNVTLGHSATVHGATLDDFILVGMGATILDGAQIGQDCLIGAHALVTEGMVVPPRSLVLGTPGRVVRSLTDEEVKMIHDRADHYVQYVQVFRKSSKQSYGKPLTWSPADYR